LDLVELAVVIDGVACPQLADHLDGFLEHREAHVRRWPAVAEDVLVERLTAADPEEEPTVTQQGGCRGGLGEYGGMDADDRTGNADTDAYPLRRLGDGTEHRPYERAVALRAHPRMKVIRGGHEFEPRFLSAASVAHELGRPV